jgi:hypothetical protein
VSYALYLRALALACWLLVLVLCYALSPVHVLLVAPALPILLLLHMRYALVVHQHVHPAETLKRISFAHCKLTKRCTPH